MGRMVRSRFWAVLGTVLLTVSLLATGCAGGGAGQPAASQSGGVVKIGIALSATGALIHEGESMKRGYDLWKDTVNEKGGLDVGGKKYKVDLVYYDDKSDATTGAKLIEKLVTDDKVNFIFGPFGSGVTAAVSAISEKYKTIMIAPIANAETVFNRGFKYLFGILPPVDVGFGEHIDYIKTLNPKIEKLAIIFPDDLYPVSAAEVAKKKAEAAGINVAFFQKYPKGTQDLSSVLSQVKSAGADGLLISGYIEDYVLAMKTAKELKLNVKYVGGMGVPTPDFVKALGSAADYTFDSHWWEPPSGWKGPVFGSSQEYNDLYKKKYGEDATYYPAAATNAGLILQLAIEKAGSLDTEKVREALHSLDVETFFGPLKYDATGMNRSGMGVIIQVRNGQMNIAYPEKLVKEKATYPMPEWDKR